MALQRLQQRPARQPLIFGVEDKFCRLLLPSYVIMCTVMRFYSLPNSRKLSLGNEVQLIVALCRRCMCLDTLK